MDYMIWRDKYLENKILAITAGLLTAMALTACGKDPELTQFREEIDAFVLRSQTLTPQSTTWMPNPIMQPMNF